MLLSYPHFGPKNTRSNFSSISDTFSIHYVLLRNFPPRFNCVFFTIPVFNSLAHKAIQSIFLALQVIWKFLNQVHIFLHFIPSFRIKSYEKGILVISYSGTHFSPYNLSLSIYNLSVHIINQILSKNLFSIASESVSVVLVLRGILVFSHPIFLTERYFKIPYFGSLFVLSPFCRFFNGFTLRCLQNYFFYQFYFTFLQISPNSFLIANKSKFFLTTSQSNSF